ncbi:hypothetical protein V6N12_069557 [Hibiscus sabdariffa]|uniref:CCHC-type domain-containing protein n=1 Tax=Hibiscus sabdariffa TaxID=183260 RepID=A0ABR2FE67_9ROSI
MELANGGNSSNTQNDVEKLVGASYKYWRMCMEGFLQGQDLWDLVIGANAAIPTDIQENVEARRKLKIKCGKVLFTLHTPISNEFIDHVRDVNSPKQLWETLEGLFSKKNTAHLQFLENDLASLTQGWPDQPSVEELESLLSNQEAFAKQMEKRIDPEVVLFSKGKHYKKYAYYKSNKEETNEGKATVSYSAQIQNVVKCYRCGKPRHIKKYCRVKLSKVNIASEKDDDDQIKWE